MKETKTVQVYPSDDIVNATIEEYGSFGWEVIGNQRHQEYTGQTGSIEHYSTFNKITFAREKNSAWYEEVAQMEREYYSLKDTRKSYRYREPKLKEPRPQGTARVALGLWLYIFFVSAGNNLYDHSHLLNIQIQKAISKRACQLQCCLLCKICGVRQQIKRVTHTCGKMHCRKRIIVKSSTRMGAAFYFLIT